MIHSTYSRASLVAVATLEVEVGVVFVVDLIWTCDSMFLLRDFYNGRDMEFTLEKQQICDECEGTGSEDGQVDTCSKCRGQGMIVQKHMLAPGIFQQVQMACDQCGGQGKTIKHRCKVCSGNKVIRKPVTSDRQCREGYTKRPQAGL